MKQNVHKIDRVARLVLGAALVAFYFFGTSEYRIFGLIGFIPLVTGLIGFCPVYSLLGIDGCKYKHS